MEDSEDDGMEASRHNDPWQKVLGFECGQDRHQNLGHEQAFTCTRHERTSFGKFSRCKGSCAMTAHGTICDTDHKRPEGSPSANSGMTATGLEIDDV